MERNNIVDSFRTLAITLVTGFHVFGWALVGSGVEWFNMSTPLHFMGFDASALIGNGWVGVGMFFVISGYCMAQSTERYFSRGIEKSVYCKYLLNRFLRIAFPYYASIVFWVIVIRYYGIVPKSTGVWDVVTHVLFIHNFSMDTLYSISGVYWTIAVEMQFYIILPLFIALCRNTSAQMSIVLCSFVVTVAINKLSTNVILTWSIVSYLYLFLLGWLFSLHQTTWRSFFERRFVFYLSLLFLISLLFYKGKGFDNNFKLYEILTSSIFSVFMMSSIYRVNGRNKLIVFAAYIGKCSYSIYLYNYIFWVMSPGNHSVGGLIKGYCIAFLFGTLMHYLIERNTEKYRKYVMKRSYKIQKT